MTAEPTIFGRYQLLEPIAKGGMAEVFKARLVAAAGTEKVLCIKRILPHLSNNQDFVSLFVQEASIALSLNHGNITQVFDFGEVDGVFYLAMELISGQDLSAVLARLGEVDLRVDVPAALYIGTQVCKGLQYAHSFTDGQGRSHVVVHRDVTPHNILISYTGEVKLTDFGIALAATKVAREERVVRGKAMYLSPEQAGGSPGDPRSDIFSLGVVLYEMLTGVRPFDADSEAEVLERVKQHQPRPPSELDSRLDAAVDQAVMRALHRDPGQRFARAADMEVALSQLLHGQWPDFTGSRLAETMHELFAFEVGEAAGGEGRDRLLYQLSRAGVKVDGVKADTSELLELGTVAIPGAAPRDPATARRKRVLIGAGGLAAVVAGVVVLAVILGGGGNGGGARVDADPGPSASMAEHTEHLVPASLRKDPVQEPVPPAPEPKDKDKDKQEPRTTPAPQRKVAYLNCNSWPWSIVYINGRRMHGNTPLFRVRVTAGKHRVRFVNPELGLSKEVTVTVEPGNTKTVAVSLQQ